MHATGDEYSRPHPVCDRDMKALEIFFEAMHGKGPGGRRAWENLCKRNLEIAKCPMLLELPTRRAFALLQDVPPLHLKKIL